MRQIYYKILSLLVRSDKKKYNHFITELYDEPYVEYKGSSVVLFSFMCYEAVIDNRDSSGCMKLVVDIKPSDFNQGRNKFIESMSCLIEEGIVSRISPRSSKYVINPRYAYYLSKADRHRINEELSYDVRQSYDPRCE